MVCISSPVTVRKAFSLAEFTMDLTLQRAWFEVINEPSLV